MSTTRLCQHAGPIAFHNLLSSTEKINEKKAERDREEQVPNDTTEFSLAQYVVVKQSAVIKGHSVWP